MNNAEALRSTIIDILVATRGESEGHTADAILLALTDHGYVRVPDGFVHASDYMEAIGRMEMIRGASQHCDCSAFEIAADYMNETHGGQMPLTAAHYNQGLF